MTRYAAAHTVLLLAATLLGVPLACGLHIEDPENPGGPELAPPQGVPPIGLPATGGQAGAGSAWGNSGTGGAYLVGAGAVPNGWENTVAGSGGAAGVGGSVSPPETDAGGSNDAPATDSGACPSGDCDDRPPVCLTNEECDDALCVNNRCQAFCAADDECAEGEGCVLGLCRPDAAGFECIVAGDCPDSDDCVGGSCRRRCLTAEHCIGCDDGPVCALGYCGQ
jgi:hypothetical protein